MALNPARRPLSLDGALNRIYNRGLARRDQEMEQAAPASASVAAPVRTAVSPDLTASPDEAKSRAVQFRREVAEDIIKRMETGDTPWQKPWDPSIGGHHGMPRNAISGRPYHGMNSFILEMSSKNGDPRWMTYKQAEEKGWKVRPGERGTRIEFWQRREVESENTKLTPDAPAENGNGEDKTRSYLVHRTYVVFNASQVDGIPPLEPKPLPPEKERFEKAEAVAMAVGASVVESKNGRAYYAPALDTISMPPRGAFHEAGGYESTLLHEAAHATGHQSRLDRSIFNAPGSPNYAKEELRAEMTSAILSRELGVPHDPNQHAAYAKTWVEVVKNDPNELFRSASDAQKIAGYMIDRAIEKGVAIENTIVEKRDGSRDQNVERGETAPAVKVLGQDVHRWSGRITEIAEDRSSAVVRASGRDTVIKMPDGQTLPDGVEKGAYGKLTAARDNQPARFTREEKKLDKSKQRSRSAGREIDM